MSDDRGWSAGFDRLERPLIDLLVSHAREFGSNPFIRTSRGDCSYADFDGETSRIAGWLATAGVGPGDVVAVFAPNCLELIQVWFACMKLGAAAAPMNAADRGRALDQ
jgi:acyl-CoA synthetase (AMP-forming)/AMP-acid ligase II